MTPELAFAAFHKAGEIAAIVPGDAVHRDRVHILDPGKDALQEVAVLGLHGGDREAAIAGDDRGHAVEARHGRIGVEGDLRVVMGVGVDDAGRHDHALGVDLFLGGMAFEMGQFGDLAVLDADIDPAARQACPVNHIAVADDQIVRVAVFTHCGSPLGRIVSRHPKLNKQLVAF